MSATTPSTAGRVLVVGEALVDIVAHTGVDERSLPLVAHPGGSPANVAVGLARLGVPTSFAGRISATGFGPWLRAHLTKNGVDTAPCVITHENASLALVTFEGAGLPSYTFYVDGTADWQWQEAELPVLPLIDVAAVHTGSLAAALEPGRQALENWLSRVRAGGRVFVSFDPNVRPTLINDLSRYREQTARLVARSHLVKVSEDDLRVLHPTEDPLAVATRWAASGPETVVVTHGPEGASAVRAIQSTDTERGPTGQVVHRPAAPTAVVDTVGAGDAFTAGLLTWLVQRGAAAVGAVAGYDAEELGAWLDFANQVAGMTCGRAGADPPRRSELPC